VARAPRGYASFMTVNTNVPQTDVVRDDMREILANDLPWHDLHGKTILVAGASGMIPSYVVRTLLAINDARDARITVLGVVRNGGRARAAFADLGEREDLKIIEHDVTVPLDDVTGVDLVVNGASPARPSLHSARPVDTIRANVQGAFNLLDLCARTGAGYVTMSSAEVYGAQPDAASLISETDYGPVDILNPRSSYTEGKRASETVAVTYRAQYDLRVTIARFGHIYGPGMALDDGRVQADFTADVIGGRDILLNSDGSARRTYTYLADAVAGLFFALLRGDELAYNVADRDGFVTIRDLAETFAAARPSAGLRVRFGDGVDVSKYNPTKGQGLDDARLRALGWTAKVTLADGVSRTIAWHEQRAEER